MRFCSYKFAGKVLDCTDGAICAAINKELYFALGYVFIPSSYIDEKINNYTFAKNKDTLEYLCSKCKDYAKKSF